ncbi:MAG: hypothetical protein K6U02_11570 [Firmicutes bacterium]|nr:hypothetical protein [Bacillota bacterium]
MYYSLKFRKLQTGLCLLVLVGAPLLAHNVKGVNHPTLAMARAQSPNANVNDFPIPTDSFNLSIVCFKIRNTSPDDSRITAVGLELPGSLSGFKLLTPTDIGFELSEDPGTVPGFPGVVLDFALVTGRNFAGGRPNLGLPPSNTPTTFCVMGPFDPNLSIEKLLDNVYIRFQRVGTTGELSDVGIWDKRLPQ